MIDHSYAQANTESIGTSNSQRTSDIIDINHVIIHLYIFKELILQNRR